MLKLDYFLLKLLKDYKISNQNYLKILKYTRYFIYYYQNQPTSKYYYNKYLTTR